MGTTKVFMKGRSQAVAIPEAYRFYEKELFITKAGDSVILTPKSSLKKDFFEGIGMLTDDFMADDLPESMDSQREVL